MRRAPGRAPARTGTEGEGMVKIGTSTSRGTSTSTSTTRARAGQAGGRGFVRIPPSREAETAFPCCSRGCVSALPARARTRFCGTCSSRQCRRSRGPPGACTCPRISGCPERRSRRGHHPCPDQNHQKLEKSFCAKQANGRRGKVSDLVAVAGRDWVTAPRASGRDYAGRNVQRWDLEVTAQKNEHVEGRSEKND
eukprot:COSAG04_NODE_259_length_18733_cov_5.191371_7_plen_195_part_00